LKYKSYVYSRHLYVSVSSTLYLHVIGLEQYEELLDSRTYHGLIKLGIWYG